jgi:hypothetical protein
MYEYEGGTVVYCTTVEISSETGAKRRAANLKIVASASFSLAWTPAIRLAGWTLIEVAPIPAVQYSSVLFLPFFVKTTNCSVVCTQSH